MKKWQFPLAATRRRNRPSCSRVFQTTSISKAAQPSGWKQRGTTNLPPSNRSLHPQRPPVLPCRQAKSRVWCQVRSRLHRPSDGCRQRQCGSRSLCGSVETQHNSLLLASAWSGLDVSDSGLVRIKNIVADSVVARDGRVREGDILLNFNGAELGNLSTQGIEQMIV